VSLRTEFDSLLLGQSGETPIGQATILRRVRRNADDTPLQCACRDAVSMEPAVDYGCVYCLGVGYLFDEELVTSYKVVVTSLGESSVGSSLKKSVEGESYLPAARFYLQSSVMPYRYDQIVEVELGEDGSPVLPYNRTASYEIVLVRDMRGDYGRIEYWVCTAQRVGPRTVGT
jgi:hypothetical protein